MAVSKPAICSCAFPSLLFELSVLRLISRLWRKVATCRMRAAIWVL